MALFDRLSRVVRAELNYAKNQSVNPEQEVERAISMLQDAVIKTRLAIAKTPPDQATNLRLTLRDLETKLSSVRTRRVELVSRVRMETRLQEINKLTGNDLNELIGLFEEINDGIAAMKAQLLNNPSSPTHSHNAIEEGALMLAAIPRPKSYSVPTRCDLT